MTRGAGIANRATNSNVMKGNFGRLEDGRRKDAGMVCRRRVDLRQA